MKLRNNLQVSGQNFAKSAIISWRYHDHHMLNKVLVMQFTARLPHNVIFMRTGRDHLSAI